MQNYKVEVQNHSESIEAQELFFNLGYSWFHKKFEAIEIKTPETIMCFENGALTTGIRGSAKNKQITLQELRAMVTPNQKEYLVKTDIGYVLQVPSDVVDGYDGIIEVPDGAESFYEYHDKTYNCCHFLKTIDGNTYFKYRTSKEWLEWNNFSKSGHDGFKLVWQRESLNDQVASVEKARQEQAQCKCSTKELHESELVNAGQKIVDGFTQPEELPFVGGDTKFSTEYKAEFIDDNPWSTQIGGDHYKKLAIQPMEYALQNKLDYAQANVVKYVTRHADKNGKQDLLKAIHNIELMIAHYYPDQE